MAVRPKASALESSVKRGQSLCHLWCEMWKASLPSLARGCPAPSASHPPPLPPRMQEVIIVVLDVGPQMSEHLVHVRKSLFLLAESKV